MAHGIRAARRDKELSRPCGGKSYAPASKFFRKLSHHTERCNFRNQVNNLVEEAVAELQIFNSEIEQLLGILFLAAVDEGDWMPKRAKYCAAVHVTSGRVYFN